jgi:hypothetical protein
MVIFQMQFGGEDPVTMPVGGREIGALDFTNCTVPDSESRGLNVTSWVD